MEASLETSIRQVRAKLESGSAVLVYDDETETTNIFLSDDPVLKKMDAVTRNDSLVGVPACCDRLSGWLAVICTLHQDNRLLAKDLPSFVLFQRNQEHPCLPFVPYVRESFGHHR